MKNQSVKVLSNAFWMTFDRVFMLLLNMFVTVRIANYFGSSEYGNYQYAVNIVAILELVVTFVDARIVKKRYINEDPDSLVLNATICRLIFSFLAIIIGVIYLLFTNPSFQFAVMFMLLLINAVVTNLRFGMSNRFEYLLMSQKKVIASDIAALTGAVLQILAVSLNCSIIAISVIAIISSSINWIILKIQYNIIFKTRKKGTYNPIIIKDMIKESLPLAIAASCATIYTRSDSVMLGALMTTAEVGVYSISVKLISIVQIALSPIRESVYPNLIQLYSLNREKYTERYVQISSVLTWIYVAGVLLSFIILPYVFDFLNPEYAEAYPIYKIHVIGTFFMYNAALRAGHLTLINRGSILTYTQIFSVIANIVMNYWGINAFGMYGAVIATVITQGLSLMFSNVFFGKEGRQIFMWQIKALNPVYALQAVKHFIKRRSNTL